MKLTSFLKTDSGQNVLAMDFFGYPLADNQSSLTPFQYYFILKGRADLEKKRNTPDEKEQKFNKLRSMKRH